MRQVDKAARLRGEVVLFQRGATISYAKVAGEDKWRVWNDTWEDPTKFLCVGQQELNIVTWTCLSLDIPLKEYEEVCIIA